MKRYSLIIEWKDIIFKMHIKALLTMLTFINKESEFGGSAARDGGDRALSDSHGR